MSVPRPRQLPRIPINDPSPPEFPPGVESRLKGLTVTPYELLEVSSCICSYDTNRECSVIEVRSIRPHRQTGLLWTLQQIKAAKVDAFSRLFIVDFDQHIQVCIKVCGWAVRTSKTHPACHKIFKARASPSAFSSAHATNPALRPKSFIPTCSFTRNGRPRNGPRGLLYSAKKPSSSSARARALSCRSSVAQLVYHGIQGVGRQRVGTYQFLRQFCTPEESIGDFSACQVSSRQRSD